MGINDPLHQYWKSNSCLFRHFLIVYGYFLSTLYNHFVVNGISEMNYTLFLFIYVYEILILSIPLILLTRMYFYISDEDLDGEVIFLKTWKVLLRNLLIWLYLFNYFIIYFLISPVPFWWAFTYYMSYFSCSWGVFLIGSERLVS
jgi:hypothetical protein